MKAWLSPEGDFYDLRSELGRRVASLRAAHSDGARFLAHIVRDNRDSAEWAFACFHSSLAFVPLPPDLPAQAFERRIRQLPPGVVFTDSLSPASSDETPAIRDRNEIWAVIFSSGTTGEPKGVALTGSALEASARSHALHSSSSQLTSLLDLPLYHVGGLSILTRALFLNTPIALGPTRFSASETARWLRSGLVQALSLVPTTLVRLLDENPDFSSLSRILVGGASTRPELLSRARKAGAPIYATYGMTEHSSQIATETEIDSGLVALPGVELLIQDGEICVRSPALASGLYRNGALEPLSFRSGYFSTGDLGEIHDGKLFIHGRASEVISSGGKKIYPAEVEAELAVTPGVSDCAVLGLPDPEWGEIACAAIVEKMPGSFDPTRAKNALNASLESFKAPKRWAILPKIPRTPSGKVIRAELRAVLEAYFKSSRS